MISIIVPIYKVAPYLRECVQSILSQTYHDLEILLIDDGSPDKSGEICEEYKKQDSRIRVIHTENQGLSAARNIGLKAAIGEYLGFVDSDDWIEPDMYEVLANRLEKTGSDISACGYQIESTNPRESMFDAEIYSSSNALKALLFDKINNNVWNKLYRREVFQDVFFPEKMNYEDVAVMHRIVDRARAVAVIPDVLYHYRVRQGSITKTYNAENIIDYADAYFERYKFLADKRVDQYTKEEIFMIAAKGISKVWRWWYGCSAEEKRQYNGRIKELHQFNRENIPLFGYRSWPISMRLSAVFMQSSSKISFAILYTLNQIYRKLWPEKANVV